MDPHEIKTDEDAEPYLFDDANQAFAEINRWVREVQPPDTPLSLLPLIDRLTEWEIKKRFNEKVLNVFDAAVAALQKRFNKGQLLLSDRPAGTRVVNLPGVAAPGEATTVLGEDGQPIPLMKEPEKATSNIIVI